MYVCIYMLLYATTCCTLHATFMLLTLTNGCMNLQSDDVFLIKQFLLLLFSCTRTPLLCCVKPQLKPQNIFFCITIKILEIFCQNVLLKR